MTRPVLDRGARDSIGTPLPRDDRERLEFETGRPRGFAFVIMGSDADDEAANAALDGKELDERSIKVNGAQDKPRTGGGGGGGGRGRCGGRGQSGGGGGDRW